MTRYGSFGVSRMTIVVDRGTRSGSEDVSERIVLPDETRQFGQRIRRGTVRPDARAERRLVASVLAA